MDSLIIKIKKHIAHEDYLTGVDVKNILDAYPEYSYIGEAYRVLMFSHENNFIKSHILEDSSFSKSLRGIHNYLFKQDLDYYKYLVIYRVDIVGLNLAKFADDFGIDYSDILKKEEEIVSFQIENVVVLRKGNSIEIFDEIG